MKKTEWRKVSINTAFSMFDCHGLDVFKINEHGGNNLCISASDFETGKFEVTHDTWKKYTKENTK